MKRIFTSLFTILTLQAMSKQITSSITINASPEKIWSILMDFEKYNSWNPFIKSISGTPMVGKHIATTIHPPGGSAMNFKPKVLTLDSQKEFKWLGHFLFKGLFDGEHKFEIIKNDDKTCTFIQSENFKGFLVPFFTKMLDNNTLDGFNQMNKKLKLKAEE